ncbi:MAG: PfkB family carbohydrate kinase [Pseudomonadota bacterium]
MERDQKNQRRRATMKDVARLAGVSIGTVSHVLNSSKGATASTVQAVNAAVAELDYRPNSLARSLIARRPGKASDTRPRYPRLVTVGYLSIDYMVSIDRVPPAGSRVTSNGIEKMLGGPAANVAAFAAGLGAPLDVHVEIVSHVGDDADSDWALEELAQRGIDASGTVQQRGRRLSRCIVLVDGEGQRTILNEPLQVPVDLVSRHLGQEDDVGGASCVHFDGFHLETAAKAHRALREAGHSLSFHSAGLPQDRATLAHLDDLMGMFDLMLLSQDAFAEMAKDDSGLQARPESILDRSDDPVCRAVILTRGSAGALLLRPGMPPFEVPAPETDVVDATGAGDALAGIFLGSWLSRGDPEAALIHAVHGASLSLGALGAQGLLPRAGDIDSTLAAEMLESQT